MEPAWIISFSQYQNSALFGSCWRQLQQGDGFRIEHVEAIGVVSHAR